MLLLLWDSWGNDDFIAYIELGGLGHWGEGMFTQMRAFANCHERSSKDYIAPFQ
ncbi:MAG: hypothetical protein ACLS3V_00515 [Streptococcus sp.]